MPHIRWAALGLAVALLAARDQDSTRIFRGNPAASAIEGTWEIVSVHRDGEADPVQVGAHLIFDNAQVTFQPNARQFNDTFFF